MPKVKKNDTLHERDRPDELSGWRRDVRHGERLGQIGPLAVALERLVDRRDRALAHVTRPPRLLDAHPGLRDVRAGQQEDAEAEQAGVLLITHYTHILRYIHPQFVHVFVDGRIVESGGPELADELEENGYVRFTQRAAATS